MFHRFPAFGCVVALAFAALVGAGSASFADDAAWRVGKASGEVWVTNEGVQKASLNDTSIINPGDSIRTGRNGRVLLVRGEETILIAPNSVVGIPAEKKEGLPTTIVQQAGTIFLKVEKRDVQHFEVETPYLAAVVKGTEFRVTVNSSGSHVAVTRGAVQVSDFQTGQFALVSPGQTAKVSAQGSGGLSLSGSGRLGAVERGAPRTSAVKPVSIPRDGLRAPRGAPNGGQIRALGRIDSMAKANAIEAKSRVSFNHRLDNGHGQRLRIAAPIGEVNLDVKNATKGLAHGRTLDAAAAGAFAKQTGPNSRANSDGNGRAGVNDNGNRNGNGGGFRSGFGDNGSRNGDGNGGNGAGNGNSGGLGGGFGGGSSNAGVFAGNGNGNGNGGNVNNGGFSGFGAFGDNGNTGRGRGRRSR